MLWATRGNQDLGRQNIFFWPRDSTNNPSPRIAGTPVVILCFTVLYYYCISCNLLYFMQFTVFHAIYCISCDVLYLMYLLMYLKPEPACAAIIPWLIDHLWVGFGSTGSPPSPSATLAIRPRDSTADASPSVSGTPGLFKDGLQPTPVVFGGKNESFGKDGIRTHGHCVSLCLSERSINCAMVPWAIVKVQMFYISCIVGKF